MTEYKCPHSFTTTDGNKSYCIECGAEHLAHIELLEEFGDYAEKRIGYFELNHRNLIDAGIEKGRQMIIKEIESMDKRHTVGFVLQALKQKIRGASGLAVKSGK